MAAPGFADAADVEALIAYISNELIPARVAALAAARPRRILARTSGQSVPQDSTLALSGHAGQAGDQGNGSGITYAGGIVTVSASGIYQIGYGVIVGPNSAGAGNAGAQLRINGVSTGLGQSAINRGSAGEPSFSGFVQVNLTAGDEVTLVAININGAGGALPISSSRLTIEKVA